MSDQNYNDLYENLLKISGNEISSNELYVLLVHAVFLKNGFILKEGNAILNSDWNKEYGKFYFEYSVPINAGGNGVIKVYFTTKQDNSNKIEINLSGKGNNNTSVDINTSLSLQDNHAKKIDFK